MVKQVGWRVLMASTELVDLEEIFRALANQNRLRILQLLRQPHVTAELNIAHPDGHNGGDVGSRLISRQALCRHLDQLRAAGLVQRDPNSDPRQPSYVVNPVAMKESVRKIYEALVADAAAPPAGPVEAPRGPHLIVLDAPSGEYAVPLDARRDSWSLGRFPDDSVPLDFDPSVRTRHAILARNRTDFGIVSQGAAEVKVNFARVEPHKPATVRHGDILTIGGTRIAFRDP